MTTVVMTALNSEYHSSDPEPLHRPHPTDTTSTTEATASTTQGGSLIPRPSGTSSAVSQGDTSTSSTPAGTDTTTTPDAGDPSGTQSAPDSSLTDASSGGSTDAATDTLRTSTSWAPSAAKSHTEEPSPTDPSGRPSFDTTSSSSPSSSPTPTLSSSVAPTAVGNLSTSKPNHAGAIAGGVIGGLLGLLALLGLLFWFRRRQRRLKVAPSSEFLTGGGAPAVFFSSARAHTYDEPDDAPEKPPRLQETWISTIAEKVRAAEDQRGQWGAPNHGPELRPHSYGLQQDMGEPDDLSTSSPLTEQSARFRDP